MNRPTKSVRVSNSSKIFRARPELDALAVLGGEHDFLAHSLFFAVAVGEVDPSARRKIAIDRFVIDDLLKSIAVAKGPFPRPATPAVRFRREGLLSAEG
jgi:hypothetical protein